MSKYVIDTTLDNVKKVIAMGVTKGGAIWTDTTDIENLEELNSDYVKEHFGSLQDDAYRCGLEEGNDIGYKKGLKDGKQTAVGAAELREKLEYQRGLEDAWNVARKIAVETDDGGVSISALYEMFGTESMCMIMKNNTVYDAADKLKSYEEKQKAKDKIEVGDEVTHKSDSVTWTAVVTQNDNGMLTLMDRTGAIADDYDEKCFVKTGRHFDIQSILEAMKA